MQEREKLHWGRYVALALLAVLIPVASASSAQSRPGFGDVIHYWVNGRAAWKGAFTLPFEVLWGNATLPAGDYHYSINSGGALGRVISIYGGANQVFVLAASPVSQCESNHMGLFIANEAGERRVYMLHLADAVFTFAGRNAEKELSDKEAGQADCTHLLCCRTKEASSQQHASRIERIPVSTAGL
jgi:hypothetical protein